MSLLAVENLQVQFATRDRYGEPRVARALNGVSFEVSRGEVLGLVGETGAGKSLTALSIMGLLRAPARRVAGRVVFDGIDLADLPQEELRRIRGGRIGMVVQSPRSSLDPLTRVGDQIARAYRAHHKASQRQAVAKAVEGLRAVRIPDAERRAAAWPHELSGGMAQRVLIAIALVNDPQLLIADEPTTGLDVTVQAQVLDLMRDAVQERGLGAILITHDLGVVAQYCDRVAVMFAGTVVEQGPVSDVFEQPRHPYTIRLLASAPDRVRLSDGSIRAGLPPDLYALPEGCPYQPRCPRRQPVCRGALPSTTVGQGHLVRCHFPEAA
jgi:peptide/nickel transport system ATP-binding protein/oligopeptide transport system ATP-binding protein